MDEAILHFFNQMPAALPLYEQFERRIFAELEGVTVKVQKTQISFVNRHLFACVSFARVRKKKDCPNPYLVITFGLDRKVESPRIDVATEPYPNRWTHHLLISKTEEIDGELIAWVKEAAAFAAYK
ncbi:DUF5655 domain-containing protein [Anaerotruncus sp. 1XD42-93]|jgi:hypothetical protein|uniref:DUF5655 domain-containing protein n=1 Tax=Anaerotruncus sp. 1XD42-93 TaxID=2320853 RepID=UPI000EA09EA5|nr:DUF5655 domain-containing protein [Anaerotruncus sp. 1XD42-93]NBK18665.1 hypothetical protein [Anaerotruncus sp. 1XD42-93]RKJ88771.1 hypothetical protein D7Y41_17445 [Anaerotruncus sp. 1XD22-93]